MRRTRSAGIDLSIAILLSCPLLAACPADGVGDGPEISRSPPPPPSVVPSVGSHAPSPFTVTRLAEGVYAAVVDPSVPAYAFANSLFVIGDGGVLVVDTQQHPAAARALIAEIRSRTDLPVRWVVNTHWHGDHTWGNGAYVEAFPEVHILAHPLTRDSLVAGWARQADQQRAHTRTTLARIDSLLASETDAARLEELAAAADVREGYLRMLDTLEIVPPDRMISEPTRLDLGGRSVHLLPLGPAHTPGDLAVFVPDVGVIAVGDLIEEGELWLEGADPEGWILALREIVRLEPRILLPSHGGVQHDLELLGTRLRELEERRSGEGDPGNR